MRRKVVIRRVRPRPVIRVHSRPYYSTGGDVIAWGSVPGWIQILIILIIVGGIAAGIYFGVTGRGYDDYDEYEEITVINNRPWWN
tara:strand:- start:873 stop:1127 length:255 start_codon:yes stop_codon:yes gene_type:complete